MLYKQIAKPLLFRMDPESAHHLAIEGLHIASSLPGGCRLINALYGLPDHESLQQHLWGALFKNPIGLAAGLDKNAHAVDAFFSIGFGFVEIGTVTPRPQSGNPRPRVFRLPEDGALINRLGFNSQGAEKVAERLRKRSQRHIPLAANLGKNKTTPNEHAVEDYLFGLRTMYPHADYFVVNISSPNTPDLRQLQLGDQLKSLLSAVIDERDVLSDKHSGPKKPILVKIAPDLNDAELQGVIETLMDCHVSGVIATNTTTIRDGLQNIHRNEAGGVSGRPLRELSTRMIRSIYRMTRGKLPIIGCGGVMSSEDAYQKIKAGASLVQIYTGLIYEGPGIIRDINDRLVKYLREDGFAHISEAVGVEST